MNPGKRAEDVAARYLLRNSYKILARNFNARVGEIDIVAEKNNEIIFVEVKGTMGDYNARERITREKMNKIYKAADCFLKNYRGDYDSVRVDVIEVCRNKVNHIIDIWECDI